MNNTFKKWFGKKEDIESDKIEKSKLYSNVKLHIKYSENGYRLQLDLAYDCETIDEHNDKLKLLQTHMDETIKKLNDITNNHEYVNVCGAITVQKCDFINLSIETKYY